MASLIVFVLLSCPGGTAKNVAEVMMFIEGRCSSNILKTIEMANEFNSRSKDHWIKDRIVWTFCVNKTRQIDLFVES